MTANVQRKPRTFVRKGDHQPRFQPVISMRDPIITRHPPTIPVLTSVKPTPAPRSWTTNRNGITNGIHNGTRNGIPNGIHNGGLRNHNGAHHQQFEKQQNTLNRQRIFLFDPRNIESMDSSSMVCAFARPVNVVKIDEPIYETIYPVNDENCEKQESDSIDSGIKFIDGEGSDGTNFPNSRFVISWQRVVERVVLFKDSYFSNVHVSMPVECFFVHVVEIMLLFITSKQVCICFARNNELKNARNRVAKK